MALTDPPQVEFDRNGTWLDTEWAPEDNPPAYEVQRGRNILALDGVEWLHWTVGYGIDTPYRVCRLRCKGPDAAGAVAIGAFVLIAGKHSTRLRRTTGSETIVRDGNPFTVGG